MINENLIKPSKTYNLLKKVSRFGYQIFYNNIYIDGIENVPEEGPVIFAPNHQNALMDALAIILYTDKQPIFLAKADIFENNLPKKILNFLKIIPVYRIRDGIDNINNNDESFNISLQCLVNGGAIGIMPEGTDIDKQMLRPLKKGISRIAFQAQEQLGEKTDVKVIPVGIHYSNYKNFRSNIHITFGKPILVKDYFKPDSENQQTEMMQLKDKIAAELKKLMVNIESTEHYQLIYDIKNIVTPDFIVELKLPEDYHGQFLSEKVISDQLLANFKDNPALADDFKPLVDEYKNTLQRLKLRNDVFCTFFPEKYLIWDIVRYVFAIPFVLSGAFYNAIPAIVTWFFSSRIKDSQYVSSFKFVIGLVVFTIYYLIILLMPFPLIIKLFWLAIMPILGVLAYEYFQGIRIFIATLRFRTGFNRNDPSYSRLNYVRLQIVKKVKELI